MGMFVVFTEGCLKDNLFISLYEQFSAFLFVCLFCFVFVFCLKTVGEKTFPLVIVCILECSALVSEFPYMFHSSFGLMLDCHSGILLFLHLFCLSSRSVFHSQLNVYFRIEIQLHSLLSQKYFQMCFDFSRIHSKHGKSSA